MFLTHLERETVRFFTRPNNTIAPSLVSTFLYLLIFGVGLGRRIGLEGFDYLEFLIPGLVMLNLINGAYSNPSGSLFIGRFLGHIDDILTSPMSYVSLTWVYVISGMARGFVLGLGAWLIAMPFHAIAWDHIGITLIFLTLTSIVFACFGIMVGLWAEEFDQLNIFLNFMITPLIFLGGVFYSVEQVPSAIETITQFNPLFYMINGVRYGMISHTEASLWFGFGILVVLATAMFITCHQLIKHGWHLRD
jgi:ABC-2 type transport system permease protein